MIRSQMLLGLLALILCFTFVNSEPQDPTNTLFDHDEATVWQGSDKISSVVFTPGKCFDSLLLAMTGDSARNVAEVHVYLGSPEGFTLVHQQSYDCVANNEEQWVNLEDEVCAESSVRVDFVSCSDVPVAIQEMGIGYRLHSTKRAVQQVSCTTIAECADFFVGRVDCLGPMGMKTCQYPSCFVDADCSSPLLPTCGNRDPAGGSMGSPSCTAQCHLDAQTGASLSQVAANDRCTHLNGYPFCNLTSGRCIANGVFLPGGRQVCQVDIDCTNPTFPVCNLTDNTCTANCGSNFDCWKFSEYSWCNQTSLSCIIPQCLENDDCTSHDAPFCDTTGATPFCDGCRDDNDCAHFTWARECDGSSCVVPVCRDNRDCTSLAASQCADEGGNAASYCTACSDNDDCAHFPYAILCYQVGGSFSCVTPDGDPNPTPSPSVGACIENDDCLDPDFPVCDTNTFTCDSICTSDSDCTQYETHPYCDGGSCVTVECEENEDCPADFPICQSDHTCDVGCDNHQQCHHFFWEIVCNNVTGACVEPNCLEDTDCVNDPNDYERCDFDSNWPSFAGVPSCFSDDCTINDECAKFDYAIWCDTGSGNCIVPDCFHNSECPTTDPVCTYPNTLGGSSVPGCTGCSSNDDCTHFFSERFCDEGGECVTPDCITFDDCTSPATPHCTWPVIASGNTVPGCVAGCTSHVECTQFEQEIFCDDINNNPAICITPTCIENDDCPASAPVCTYPRYTDRVPDCVAECQSHDDCSQYSEAVYCVRQSTSPDFGACVIPECLSHDDCETPGSPYCDIDDIMDGRAPSCVPGCHNVSLTPGASIHDICAKFQSFVERPGSANWGPVYCASVGTSLGSCVVPECLENDDCKSPSAPQCALDTTQGFPTCQRISQCNSQNSDCAHFYAETWCSVASATRGRCVEPRCTINEHCTDPAYPVCTLRPTSVSDPNCTRTCRSDDDCAHFVHEWYCVVDPTDVAVFGQCVDVCQDNFDCTDPDFPVCWTEIINVPGVGDVPTTPACEDRCTDNNDCAQFVLDWWCNDETGACIIPVCTPGETDQCTDPTLPYCTVQNGAPVCSTGCEDDDECSRFSNTDYCNWLTGECYDPLLVVNGCRELEDCTDPTLPVCVRPNVGDGVPTCQAACTTNDDCAHFYQEQYCATSGPELGQCVSTGPTANCWEDDDCGNPAFPRCNLTAVPPVCVTDCWSHDTCAHFAAHVFCVPPGSLSLDRGTCIIPECLEDSDCPDRRFAQCDIDGDNSDRPACVPCTEHDDCAHFSDSFCLPNDPLTQDPLAPGTCTTPACDEDDDCTDPRFPVCDRIAVDGEDHFDNRRRFCVAGCHWRALSEDENYNDVCTKFFDEVWCDSSSGACTDPICVDHWECTNPEFPYCHTVDTNGDNLVQPFCGVGCTHNDNCTRFWEETWCVTTPGSTHLGSCWEPECLEDEDCTNPAKPVCIFPGAANNLDIPTCMAACTDHDNCTKYANERWCVRDSTKTRWFGQCVDPICWEDSDCSDPAFPVCDYLTSDPPVCDNSCNSHDDCAHFANETWCDLNGECVAPECWENDDCYDPSRPVCVSVVVGAAPTCEASCTSDDDCTQYSDEVRCDAGGFCRETECFLDRHCDEDIRFPACYAPASTVAHPRGWCVECLTDDHCANARGKDGTQLPSCNIADHTCVQCNDDLDCKLEGRRSCATADHICVECVNNADCKKGDLRTCDPSSNSCVRCLADSDCGVTAPACLPGLQTCVGCLSNAHCGGSTPACQVASHTCVQCVVDSDCPVGKTCDTSNNKCVQCLWDSDCSGDTPACNVATRTCVQCSSSAHCVDFGDGSTPACNKATSMCVECTADDDCAPRGCDLSSNMCMDCATDLDCVGTDGLPACDRSSGECVPCLYSSHCLQLGSDMPACDTATRQCVQCNTDDDCADSEDGPACDVASHSCVACLTNDHCGGEDENGEPIGEYCDTAARTCVDCVYDFHCVEADDAQDDGLSVCDRSSGDGSGVCVECLVDDHCTSDPERPTCNSNGTTCVQCLTSADCWILDPSTPICDEKNGKCRGCTENKECEDKFLAFQGCDPSGTCVADSYDKGFYIAAVVLGSIAVFLVIVVLVLIGAKVAK